MLSFIGVLHDCDPAAPLDLPQPKCPVVQRASENHTDHSGPIAQCSRTEKRVDCGSVPVLFRATLEVKVFLAHDQMVIGRGDIDAAVLKCGSIGWMNGRQGTRPAE